MADINELIQQIVNKSYEEKLIACKSLLVNCNRIILNALNGDQDKTTTFMIAFLSHVIASDGQFSVKEQQMIHDLFNIDDFSAALKIVNSEGYDFINKVIDALPSEDKSTFCLLAVYIMSVDDTVSKEELGYLFTLIQ